MKLAHLFESPSTAVEPSDPRAMAVAIACAFKGLGRTHILYELPPDELDISELHDDPEIQKILKARIGQKVGVPVSVWGGNFGGDFEVAVRDGQLHMKGTFLFDSDEIGRNEEDHLVSDWLNRHITTTAELDAALTVHMEKSFPMKEGESVIEQAYKIDRYIFKVMQEEYHDLWVQAKYDDSEN